MQGELGPGGMFEGFPYQKSVSLLELLLAEVNLMATFVDWTVRAALDGSQ